MKTAEHSVQDAKQVFRDCGTCSQTFGHLMNREFGHPMEVEERALDPLAGGILNEGHQCGMLWGAILAVGAEAYRRYDDEDQAIAAAVTASQHIIESFTEKTNTVNCKEIINTDLSHVLGLVQFGLKTMIKGMNNSQCFDLADQWAPEAIQTATEGLESNGIELKHRPQSCATEVVMRMGGTKEESTMVAGFAGGLGLSGNACGALSAAIWFKTLKWCRENPGKAPSLFRNKLAKKIIKEFKKETNGELNCEAVSKRQFKNMDKHSDFIKCGGCKKVINRLSEM